MEEFPALSFWKVFNDTIPVILESNQQNLNRLTSILTLPEFAEMFVDNSKSEDGSRKYKAFTVWILGRFFYLLSQDKLSSIHNLLIDAQKRILHAIQITHYTVYHELALEYLRIMQQLNNYSSNQYADKLTIRAFTPEVLEDLKDSFDLNPLFAEIVDGQSCIYMQKVILKFIDPILIEKLQFNAITSDVTNILQNMILILKNACMDLKLIVLEIYAKILEIRGHFSIEITDCLHSISALFFQLLQFLQPHLAQFEQLQKVSCHIIENSHQQCEISTFILRLSFELKFDLTTDLRNTCLKYVRYIDFDNFDDIELYRNQIVCEIESSLQSQTFDRIFEHHMVKIKTKCETTGCCLNEVLAQINVLFEIGSYAKITLRKEGMYLFYGDEEFLLNLVNAMVDHIKRCGANLNYAKFSLLMINYTLLCDCSHNTFSLIFFPLNNFYNHVYHVKMERTMKFHKIHSTLFDCFDVTVVDKKQQFALLCYFCSLNNFRIVNELKHINEEIKYEIIPFLGSLIDGTMEFFDIVLLPLLKPNCILRLCKELPDIMKATSLNYTKVAEYDNGADWRKIVHRFEKKPNPNVPENRNDQYILGVLTESVKSLLSTAPDEYLVHVVETLPLLPVMISQMPAEMWMRKLMLSDNSVQEVFVKQIFEIVKSFMDCDQAVRKNEALQEIYDFLKAEMKNSLSKDYDSQEIVITAIDKLSRIKSEIVELNTFKLLLYYIMMPSSQHSYWAINILNEMCCVYNTTVKRMYAKHRPDLCKVIVNLCAINQAIGVQSLSVSLQNISLVLASGPKDFMVSETKYVLPLLVELVPTMVQVKSLIEELAHFNEIDVSDMLCQRYGYIFLHIFLNVTEDVGKSCMKYVEKTAMTDGTTLRKRSFMIILNELLLNFHSKRDRVIIALNHLSVEESSASQHISIPEFLQPRFLGVLQYFDLRLVSQTFNKQKVLESLADVLTYMGPKHISPLRFKIIGMLRTAINLKNGAFRDLICDVWKAFVQSCDIELLGPQLATIFVSVLPLMDKNETKINDIFKYLVIANEDAVKDNISDLFFVEEANLAVDYNVLEKINAHLKPIHELDFKEHLKYFMKFLNYETVDVQIYALKYLRRLLQKNREVLDQMILGYNGIDSSIVELLEALTSGCREHDAALRLACSECIGELGAIEPSYIPRSCTRIEVAFNFFITEPGFIFNTLTELIRALQAENNTQNMDRFSLAIQETLKIYGISPDKSSPKHDLWLQFQESHQAMMLPLLSSKYTMVQGVENITTSPIFGSNYGTNFQSWIHSWTISLFSSIKSSTKNLIEACLPSMKQDLKTLMHFLPYILLQSLIEGDRQNQKLAFDEFMAVIQSQNSTSLTEDLLNIRPIRVEQFTAIINKPTNEERYMKVVFVLLDFLDRWLREWLWDKGNAGRENENYKRIHAFFSRFCKLQLARSNYECGEFTRALMYLEDYLASNKEAFEDNLSLLAEIYYRLDEPDGVLGVAAVRQDEPGLDQRILALEVSGNLSDALACYENMRIPLNISQFEGMMRCHLGLENIYTSFNLAWEAANQNESDDVWEGQFEAFWRLTEYEDLDDAFDKFRGLKSWDVQIGQALVHMRNNSRDTFKETITSLRMAQVDSLNASSLEEGAYQHGYANITRLHAINELEQIENLIGELLLRPNDKNVVNNAVAALKSEWDLRVKVVQQSLRVSEPLLCLRRVGVKNAKKVLSEKCPMAIPLLDEILGESWLKSAEIAIAAEVHQRAYNYLLRAEEYKPPKLFLEKAKLHWMRTEHEQALTILKRGLAKYIPEDANLRQTSPTLNFALEEKKICAEAKLMIAKYNDSISNAETDVIIQHYKEAVNMFKEREKSLVSLAQYYDRVFQTYSAEEKDNKGSEMQIHMINFFGKSLQFGTTYVYQSMPRMLSIWFDYGTRLLDVTVGKVKEDRKNNLLKMTKLIDAFLERLPPFVFLTAFSQLVSRICHPQKEVYKELIVIIIKLIQIYPQQSLWMIISVVKSSYALRSKRCEEILSDSRLKTPTLAKFIIDFKKFAEKLIELCNKEISEGLNTVSISALFKTLPRMLSRDDFSQIMIPTQMFRKLVLPNPDFTNAEHNPFPNHYVYVTGIEDEMTLIPSLQRPRRITFRGSDGKKYIQMLKPKDDLRKDFRLMEFNDIVNQLLSREPESRQRRLYIRLYSVAPLNEECGLIEWVPNLVGLRPVLTTLYKQKGLRMSPREIRDACPKQSVPLSTKREIFLNTFVAKHPPVLGEWFRKTFPDAQSWLTARTAYIRTTAVMSMVGHILGLGDRHGENILFDTTCGDTVHVDFNCLFNKGECFEWPERVPFRLTHNMVAAMGPLGIEGVFRKSCACTLKVLRENRNTLMSIVTPFVYDPLVSWPRNATSASNMQNSERTNELALENIREIECRLQGKVRTKSRSYSIPLSVEGQTNRLILEAMSIDNLCQMYVGWGPYL